MYFLLQLYEGGFKTIVPRDTQWNVKVVRICLESPNIFVDQNMLRTSILVAATHQLFSPLQQLQNQIAQHAKAKEHNCGDDLREDADPGCICGKGKYEAHGFPESVVGEGSLLIVGKEAAIEGVDLRLPDRIAHPPEGGQGVDKWKGFQSWSPEEHCSESSCIDESPKDEDGHPTCSLCDKTGSYGGERVCRSVGHQNLTESCQTIGTGYEPLICKGRVHILMTKLFCVLFFSLPQ